MFCLFVYPILIHLSWSIGKSPRLQVRSCCSWAFREHRRVVPVGLSGSKLMKRSQFRILRACWMPIGASWISWLLTWFEHIFCNLSILHVKAWLIFYGDGAVKQSFQRWPSCVVAVLRPSLQPVFAINKKECWPVDQQRKHGELIINN